MEKAAKIKLFLLLAFLAVSAIILGKVYLFAASPSSVKVKVYKVELMTDASDTNPQAIFSSDTGLEIDLTNETDALIGQAEIPTGTYKRIRMTVENGIKQSIADAADNPCGGEAFTDRVFPVAEGVDPDSKVQIDFAAHDDDGGTWAGSRIIHFLLGPVTVSDNMPVQFELRFKTANTLFCSDGVVDLRSPWATWAEIL
jgi:hypothetical protein